MEKLSTIQKRNNLNTVYRDGEAGPGEAHHDYVVSFGDDMPLSDEDGIRIRFQCGPRKDPEARRGVLDGDLLEIVRDRLRAFQAGPFACRENACALTHIEEALKKLLWDKLPTNILAFLVAMAVTLLAFFALCQIMGIRITWYMVVGAVVLGIFVAYAAMFGFDKLRQTLEQINKIKE